MEQFDLQTEGPFVRAVLLCEQVLEERDSVLTPVRLIDRINVEARGPEAPQQLPPGQVAFIVLVSLVKGAAAGGVDVLVRLEPPDVIGARILWEGTLDFTGGPDQIHNLMIRTQLQVQSAGLYWIDVLLAGRRVTRTPLRVSYSRTSLPPT